jgi:hypothetical protein
LSRFLALSFFQINLGSLITRYFIKFVTTSKFVQLDATMMQLNATKCDYDVT